MHDQQLRRTELGLSAISLVTRRLGEKLLNKVLLFLSES